MILGFSNIDPTTGEFTGFEAKIISGQKIHTVRSGYRWREGLSIQMATGVRTPQYATFNDKYPMLKVCRSVQKIKITKYKVIIDGKTLEQPQHLLFAFQDGFNSIEELHAWFPKPITGQLVGWTTFKY